VTGIARQPAEGKITAWGADGSFTWVPPATFSGSTTFEYT
jgi:hypothetical protein